MAGQMRITLFFQQGDYGWTESYFPPSTDYTSATAFANLLAPIRVGLLAAGGSTPVMTGYRVSDDTVFRDALVQFFQPPLQGALSGNPLHPTTCLLLRLTATPLVRRPLYARGIPDSLMRADGSYIPGPALGAVNTLRNFLKGPPAWLVKTSLTSPLAQIFRLGNVTAPNNFTTIQPHGFNANDTVIVKGTSRHRNPVGIWKVGPGPGITTFTLVGVDLPADYAYVPLSLGVQLKTFTYQGITIVNDERITERATGRPFGVPRGRRSPHRV